MSIDSHSKSVNVCAMDSNSSNKNFLRNTIEPTQIAPKTYVVSVAGFHDDEEELITTIAFEHQCAGMSEDLPFIQESLEWEAKLQSNQPRKIQLFYEHEPSAELLNELRSRNHWCVEINEVVPKDWLSEWKKGYNSFELVGGIWIVPSWLTAPKEVQKVIKIDPGMAFGTGTHETTQIVASLIFDLLTKKLNPREIPSVSADIGSGTGVLAMLMKHLGVSKVLALDIDPECVRVCRENAEINNMQIDSQLGSIEQLNESLPLVVANIVDGILIKMAPEFNKKVLPGGFLILSGILCENREDVKRVFENSGFQLKNQLIKTEWVGMTFEKILA